MALFHGGARPRTPRPPRRVRQALALVSLLLATMAVAGAAGAQTPSLNIAITDGNEQVAPNGTLHYVVTLNNTGAQPVAGALVVTLPAYVSVGADSSGGRISGSDVDWDVTVAPGEPVTRELDVTVGAVPDGEHFVTTLASFYTNGARDVPPTVRSADADRLPGTPDPRSGDGSTTTADAPTRTGSGSGIGQVRVLVSVLLAAGVAGALVVVRRRHRHR